MKIKDLMRRSPIYNSTYKQMGDLEKSYLGGYVFKQSVRRKRPSEDSTLWSDLIQNTVAQPICRYIVDTINDTLFEPGVKRNLSFCTPTGTAIDPDMTDWVDLFTLDADLQNRNLTGFMEGVGDLTSIFGHCWVAVDMPQQQDGNLGRPYVVSISPLDVWDWEWSFYGGKPILKYVKIKEAETTEYYYIKCYHLGDEATPTHWRSYQVTKGAAASQPDQEVIAQDGGYYPPGMSIPVFIAYGRRDPRTIDIGISDIDAASDAQREYYKLECEAYTGVQFAKTIIRADKGIAIPVHAGAIVRATQGQIESISVDTGDIETILRKQADILEQIEALTGLGGLRNSKNQLASGVAIIEERKQLHKMCKAKARLMEATEELIFTYAARFMGMRWAGEISYNTDYEAYDTNYRIALMNQAKQLSPGNQIIDNLIQKEVIRMLAPANAIPEYETAFINTIENADIRQLMTDENDKVYSRDLGSMIPVKPEGGEGDIPPEVTEGVPRAENVGPIGTGNPEAVGGPGTPITPFGASLYPQQAVAVQLSGINTGR